MEKTKPMLPYLCATLAVFYIFPLFSKTPGSFDMIAFVFFPLVCGFTGYFYGLKNGIVFLYPILVAILFIPAIYLYYNATAWVYALCYGGLALIGNYIGGLRSKKEQ